MGIAGRHKLMPDYRSLVREICVCAEVPRQAIKYCIHSFISGSMTHSLRGQKQRTWNIKDRQSERTEISNSQNEDSQEYSQIKRESHGAVGLTSSGKSISSTLEIWYWLCRPKFNDVLRVLRTTVKEPK